MNIGRLIYREVAKGERRKANFRRLQKEAASRPESKLVKTPLGGYWMSPIEAKLYKAMLEDGLDPWPQYCVQGYFIDFAFPDVRVAVEADGAEYHGGERKQRDRQRDWILRRAGWTVKRFYGTTIHRKAGNCAFVVKKEVKARRDWAVAQAREKERRKWARREAMLRPFRRIKQFFRRNKRKESDI